MSNQFALCSVDGCSRRAFSVGYCHSHYHRTCRYGDPLAGSGIRRDGRAAHGVCDIGGCSEPAYRTVPFCGEHYSLPAGQRRSRGTSIDALCDEPGCTKPAFRKNRCSAHHSADRRSAPPFTAEICRTGGCEQTTTRVRVCSRHFYRVKRAGDPGPVGRQKAVPGTSWVDTHGYVYRTVNGTKIAEHRWVMEQHLRRPLWPDESVHHKNGVRTDNHLANLELWSRWQPSGQRVADKLAWAKELIARYASDLTPAVDPRHAADGMAGRPTTAAIFSSTSDGAAAISDSRDRSQPFV